MGLMGYYRKRPVVIEAVHWDGSVECATRIIDWALAYDGTIRYHDEDDALAVDTIEGTMQAQTGDWIIRGVKDEFYPCKPDIFEATYEPAPIKESVP
jgi:hypothetical protein